LEQGPAIGGYFPLLDKTFPTNSCGVCFMSPTPPAFCPIYECHLHDNIELLPYSEVTDIEAMQEILESPSLKNQDSLTPRSARSARRV
jgi:heterodisulfide reductase subunit A-like polyferredoxin